MPKDNRVVQAKHYKVMQSVFWLMARWLPLVAGLVLVGCETATSTTITLGDALAYARAVNLRVSDVPGMTSFALESARKRSIFDAEVGRCVGIGDGRPVVSVNSPRFRALGSERPLRSEAVHSAIYFVGSSSTASRNVAVMDSVRSQACLERYDETEAASRRRKFHGEAFENQIKVSLLPSLSPDVRSFGLRMSGTLAATYAHSKTRRPFFEDTLGFAVGPVVIVLRASGTPRPFPSATERRLLSLLDARARVRKL